MPSPSLVHHPKLTKPLIAVIVVASSFILGVFICISCHLRSRKKRIATSSSAEKRRDIQNSSTDMEMSNITAESSQRSWTGWIPRVKIFPSRNLKPEPFTLSQPSINVRPPQSASTSSIVVVERLPLPLQTTIDISTETSQSQLSPVSPPAYMPSETSSTSRALPTPPSSPTKHRPSLPKKKMEIATGGYLPDLLPSPPPAYKRSRVLDRSVSHASLPKSPRKALPRRPSTASMASTSLSSPTITSPPIASSSRHVFNPRLHTDGRRLPRLMTVARTFLPTFPDEVSVRTGDTVLLLEEYGDNWCLVQILASATARRGVVPRSCLQEYVDDESSKS